MTAACCAHSLASSSWHRFGEPPDANRPRKDYWRGDDTYEESVLRVFRRVDRGAVILQKCG